MMCKKLIFLTSIVLVLGLAGSAFAGQKFTWKGGADNQWTTASCWTPSTGYPGESAPNDTVSIPGTIPQGPILSGADVNVLSIEGPDPAEDTTVVVKIMPDANLIVQGGWAYDGGSGEAKIHVYGGLKIHCIDTEDNYAFRAPDNGRGYVYVYEDANVWVNGRFRGSDEDGWYEVHMFGGEVWCDNFILGDNGSGSIYLHDGNFATKGNFEIRGRYGAAFDIVVDPNAKLIIGGTYLAPSEVDGIARVSLDGYIEAKEWAAAGDNWTCDINEGMLRIKDPIQTKLQDIQKWIDKQQITGYDRLEVPVALMDGSDIVVTVSFIQKKAWNPYPAHRETHVCPNDVVLSWTPGVEVNDHNIYFGTHANDVNGTEEPCDIHWGPNDWDPIIDGNLVEWEMGKTYFWRVDTINDVNVESPWKGAVWQFTITDGTASKPNPAHERGLPASSVTAIEWKPSCLADRHKIYFALDLDTGWNVQNDNFEHPLGGRFDPNDWDDTTGWVVVSGDANYGRDSNIAEADGTPAMETLESNDVNVSDACAFNVRFDVNLTKGLSPSAELKLLFYNGSGYDEVADWNYIDANDHNNHWFRYSKTITRDANAEYMRSDFKFKLVATNLDKLVYIDNSRIRNTWPGDPKWYVGSTAGDVNTFSVSVVPFREYFWRVDTVVDGNSYQGSRWRFRTSLGGLLMWLDFDGTLGQDIPTYLDAYTETDQTVRFYRYEGGGTLKYAPPNPVYNRETGTAAVFDPCVGLVRQDPCLPDANATNPADILRLNGDQYTIELWYKMTYYEDQDQWLIGKDDPWGIQIDDPGDDDVIEWEHDGDEEDSPDGTVEIDEWVNLACVFDATRKDGKNWIMYINGAEIMVEDDDDRNDSDGNDAVSIGWAKQWDDDDEEWEIDKWFHGVMDEVRILDVALRPGQLMLTPGPEWAFNPSPFNGKKGVEPNSITKPATLLKKLAWSPGCYAAKHRVYWSTDFDDVNDGVADANLGIFDTNDTNDVNLPGFNPDDPNGFLYGKNYFWRVDELNDACYPHVWKGIVWKLTMKFKIVDTRMKVWYPFEEESGTFVTDYSGYEKHGEGDPLPARNWLYGGGRWGDALKFDDDTAVWVDNKVTDDIIRHVTVSVWLNADEYQSTGHDQVVLDVSAGEADVYAIRAMVPTESPGLDIVWQAGNDTNDRLVWSPPTRDVRGWKSEWQHFAFTKDETTVGPGGRVGEMAIYLNGERQWYKIGTTRSMRRMWRYPFKLGAYYDNAADYEGIMDDFRVYNVVLSNSEILERYRGGDLNVAWDPDPFDGQMDAPPDANLTWKPGDNVSDANAHRVFFGTSRSQVENMTDPCYVKDLGDEDVPPPIPLELDAFYYWRVDESNEDTDTNWPGRTWNFKTADYLLIDDFETYSTTGFLEATWYDYDSQWSVLHIPPRAGNVSLFKYLGYRPWVHAGFQSMEYLYGDTGAAFVHSDVWCDLTQPGTVMSGMTDWTQRDVAVLTLFFLGSASNNPDPCDFLNVGVKDNTGKYSEIRYGLYDPCNEDINDIKVEEWQKWEIAIKHFADSNASIPNDVNVANLKEFHIGVRERYWPGAPPWGDRGRIWIDDIRLSLPRCVAAGAFEYDFTGDCRVDMADLGYIARAWLLTDANYGVDAVQKPSDANLVGYWALDEGDGNIANDWSSYDHNGIIESSSEVTTYYAWVAGHNDANAFDFAVEFSGDGGRILIPDDNNTPALRPKREVSVCAWVFVEAQTTDGRVVVKGQDDEECYAIEVSDEGTCAFYVGDVNGKRTFCNVEKAAQEGEWMHLAGTYDSKELNNYINGKVEQTVGGKDANDIKLSQDLNGLGIGNRAESMERPFMGVIDEVRIYSRALTQKEVLWLASDGTGYVPLRARENLVDPEDPGQRAVNQRDAAELLRYYGCTDLWPVGTQCPW